MSIINIHFHNRDQYSISPQYKFQHDYGQSIAFSGDLPEEYEVMLANEPEKGAAERIQPENNKVLIPDEYFKTGKPIYGWIHTHYTPISGNTVSSFRIPVIKRPDYE